MKKFDSWTKSHAFVPLVDKTYAHYNPHLVVSGEEIKAIDDEGFRYLGVVIEPSLQENKSRQKWCLAYKNGSKLLIRLFSPILLKYGYLTFIMSRVFCGGSPP